MNKIQKIRKIRVAVLTLSSILFPITFIYFSPYVSMLGSTVGIISGSLVVFLGMFLVSMFFGRSFCSWLCPAGGIQEQVGKVRERKMNPRRTGWIKYAVWGIWLCMLLFFFFRVGGVKGVQVAFHTQSGLSTTSVPSLIAFSIVVLIFFLMSLIIGRRASCHTICWMAPFMVIGRKLGLALKLPSLRLSTRPETCVSCGRCTKACPMSLDVQKLVQKGEITDNSCILCGVCIDTCKKDTITWSWGTKGKTDKGES